jgi:hypothetical protein
MPSKYTSNRERLMDFIENTIIPTIKEQKDMNYYKLIDGLSEHFKVKKSLVESIINEYIDRKHIIEYRVLSIPEEKVDDWLNQTIRKKHQTTKEINEVLTNGKGKNTK